MELNQIVAYTTDAKHTKNSQQTCECDILNLHLSHVMPERNTIGTDAILIYKLWHRCGVARFV